VDSILQEVLAILQHTTNLVTEAPPGTGRTTGVPPAILGLVHDEVLRWLPHGYRDAMNSSTRWYLAGIMARSPSKREVTQYCPYGIEPAHFHESWPCCGHSSSDRRRHVAHEFVPKSDPLTSLRQAMGICDV
jgi:hypothetical protein